MRGSTDCNTHKGEIGASHATIHSAARATLAAAAIGFGLIAAACSNKKDEESVGGAEPTTPAGTTRRPDARRHGVGGREPGQRRPPTTGRCRTTTEGGDGEDAVIPTLPAPTMDPVIGGRLVVAGEAEVGAPWTPAAVQCDSYCQMRIRTFIEPLFVTGDDLEVAPASSPRASRPTTTPRCSRSRCARASRSPTARRSTPTPSIDNLNRTGTGLLVPGAMQGHRQEPRRHAGHREDRRLHVHAPHRQERRPRRAVPWPLFPYFLTGQPGFIASPTWLAAVDGNPDLATQPVGTGPFIVQSTCRATA